MQGFGVRKLKIQDLGDETNDMRTASEQLRQTVSILELDSRLKASIWSPRFQGPVKQGMLV
jgi:hypothetical protein